MTISVIIPVYNGEKFIARAIDSVLGQTLAPAEIIVIDDGSKDGTAAVLERYKGRIVYKTVPNGGASSARNHGLRMAQGEWVAFLDADDLWAPRKLEHQSAFLRKYPHVGFCCCNYHVYNPHLKQTVDHFSIFKGSGINFDAPLAIDPVAMLIRENVMGTCSNVMIKKEVLEKTGLFNTMYKQAEDYDLWIRCALVTSFIIMSEVLAEKKTHDTNLTNNQIETWSFHNLVLKDLNAKYHPLFESKGYGKLIAAAQAKKHYQIGNAAFERGEKARAFRAYGAGLAADGSLSNYGEFAATVTRKLLRLATCGLLSRKRLGM